jgi:hypothetical protein
MMTDLHVPPIASIAGLKRRAACATLEP